MKKRTVAILAIGGVAIGLAFVMDTYAQRKTMMDSARERMESAKYDEIHGRPGNGPNVGEMAPNFELMPLKFYEFGLDEQDITEANAGDLYKAVRLRDFQDKKPVVLIFGSYT